MRPVMRWLRTLNQHYARLSAFHYIKLFACHVNLQPLLFWKPFLVFVSLHVQFATEAAITILRIDDMIKLYKDDDGGEE